MFFKELSQSYNFLKDIRNLSRLEKETKVIKERMRRHIKILFEHEEEEIIINQ